MNPATTITIVTAAVAAGATIATKDLAAQATKDGYAALRALIVRKFGERTDVADALEQVERKPDSKARQGVLMEELEAAGAGRDDQVVQQARALLDLLRYHG